MGRLTPNLYRVRGFVTAAMLLWVVHPEKWGQGLLAWLDMYVNLDLDRDQGVHNGSGRESSQSLGSDVSNYANELACKAHL